MSEFPSIPDQLKSFTELVQDAILDAVKGNNIFTTEELETRRLEICRACDRFDSEQKRCKECGCYMEHKVSYNSAKCPLNYW